MDAIALLLDIQHLCFLLEQAARGNERIEVVKVNKEIHETAQAARDTLSGPRSWPVYAESIRLESMELCVDIQTACLLLEGAMREEKILKVAALNTLIYRLAKRLQRTLNDPGRFEKGHANEDRNE